MYSWSLFKSLIVVIILGSIVSCDQEFQPFQENESYIFSIQGVLNPLEETQSIRISPVRQTFRQGPDAIDAEVTLTHLESGRMTRMTGEAKQYGEDAWAWNFKTDMPILFENTYRLTATRSDGRYSQVTVRIPKAIPEPRFTCHCEYPTPATTIFVAVETFLEDVENLVVARVTYKWGAESQQSFVGSLDAVSNQFHHKSILYNGFTREEPDGSTARVLIENDLREIASISQRSRNNLFLEYAGFEIASGGPDWPETRNMSAAAQSIAIKNSNVEHGIGQVAGVVGMDIVINHNYSCSLIEPETPEPCAWVVDPDSPETSATDTSLSGTIRL